MDQKKRAFIIDDLNEKVDAVYRHGTLQERYSNIPQDYGMGFVLTESEAHTLGYVCQRGEATVTELAEFSFRTKGTISKILKKLEEKALVQRAQKEGNRKWVYFTPTLKGHQANDVHKAYDQWATSRMIEALLENCTMEDVESFYRVTQLRVAYLAKTHPKESIKMHK